MRLVLREMTMEVYKEESAGKKDGKYKALRNSKPDWNDLG
jgi:hypothetical protein